MVDKHVLERALLCWVIFFFVSFLFFWPFLYFFGPVTVKQAMPT